MRLGRGRNFSRRDTELLLRLVLAEAGAGRLEARAGAGGEAREEAAAAWARVQREYCRRAQLPRTEKNLRQKYDNFKRSLRRKLITNKHKIDVNESNELVVDALPLTAYEKQFIKYITITPELLASWELLDDTNNSNEGQKDDDELDSLSSSPKPGPAASPNASPVDQEQNQEAESFLMSIFDSSSDGRSSVEEKPLKRIKKETTIKLNQNNNGYASPVTYDGTHKTAQPTTSSEKKVLRMKAELLELQIAEQKLQMSRSTQIHTYTLKSMEADLRLKNLQERLLLKQLGAHVS